jgi:hypothetical protein
MRNVAPSNLNPGIKSSLGQIDETLSGLIASANVHIPDRDVCQINMGHDSMCTVQPSDPHTCADQAIPDNEQWQIHLFPHLLLLC